MFPLHGFIGVPAQQVVKASTVMKNQPYSEQSSYGAPTVRTCPVIP
jgi:hypothetical protein